MMYVRLHSCSMFLCLSLLPTYLSPLHCMYMLYYANSAPFALCTPSSPFAIISIIHYYVLQSSSQISILNESFLQLSSLNQLIEISYQFFILCMLPLVLILPYFLTTSALCNAFLLSKSYIVTQQFLFLTHDCWFNRSLSHPYATTCISLIRTLCIPYLYSMSHIRMHVPIAPAILEPK